MKTYRKQILIEPLVVQLVLILYIALYLVIRCDTADGSVQTAVPANGANIWTSMDSGSTWNEDTSHFPINSTKTI